MRDYVAGRSDRRVKCLETYKKGRICRDTRCGSEKVTTEIEDSPTAKEERRDSIDSIDGRSNLVGLNRREIFRRDPVGEHA